MFLTTPCPLAYMTPRLNRASACSSLAVVTGAAAPRGEPGSEQVCRPGIALLRNAEQVLSIAGGIRGLRLEKTAVLILV